MLNSESQLHFAALRSGDFDLARSGWIADLPAAENFLAVHASDAGAINYSGFDDVVYDHVLARGNFDLAEERLVEQAPILLIDFYVSRSLVGTDIGGWQDNAMNIHPSRLLYRKPK